MWRRIHFLLAFGSALFLFLTSVSGFILGIEALMDQTKPQAIDSLEDYSLKTTLEKLDTNIKEVFELVITEKNYVVVQGISKDGFENFYADPETGLKINSVTPTSPFFKLVRSFHRSLFLKNTGRIIVGIIAFLLILLSITGGILLTRRIGGIKQLFFLTKEKNIYRKGHIILGKWFFIPVLIIGFSGAYLSIERFNAFTNQESNTKTYAKGERILDLNTIRLNDVTRVSYPFSKADDEVYNIELKDRVFTVRQGDFSILSEEVYPFHSLLKHWNYYIHTGESSVFVALILTLAALAIVFFMFTGLKITSKTSLDLLNLNKNNLKEASLIILYGTETGNSYQFAKRLAKTLRKENHSLGLTSLNNYAIFPKAKTILILTATYGDGEAPSNAERFEKRFETMVQLNPINFSILGFGSKSYPKFCQYAITLQSRLEKQDNFFSLMPLFKINNQSETDYCLWESMVVNKLK